MKTVDFEPDRSVGIAHIEGYARKARALMLVKDKAVAVGKPILRKLGCRAFIELDERFNIIEEAVDSSGVTRRYFSRLEVHGGRSSKDSITLRQSLADRKAIIYSLRMREVYLVL